MNEYKALQIIWDYMILNDNLQSSDCIIAFGSYNVDVAKRAAQIYLDGYAPWLLFTGGLGRGTEGRWSKSESEIFAQIAVEIGVPKCSIIIENKSRNTGENIQFSKDILKAKGIKANKIIAVQKPYMQRRLYAALRKQWSEAEFIITSPQISFKDYLDNIKKHGLTKDELFNIIVGDLWRMDLYAKNGFQISQNIPNEVWNAFYYLKDKGYTKYI